MLGTGKEIETSNPDAQIEILQHQYSGAGPNNTGQHPLLFNCKMHTFASTLTFFDCAGTNPKASACPINTFS